MGAPRISIVLPTRNRQTLAQVALRSILDGADSDIEIVVADNSDTPTAVPDDPRIKLLPRLDQVVTMTVNWERALHATRGEWVTFISDKHRLVPPVYRRAIDLAESARTKIVSFERAYWFQTLTADGLDQDSLWNKPGTLLSPETPESIGPASARATMHDWFSVIRGASQRPQIYRGAIHRSLLESVMRKAPRFFFGTCPDYASGLQALSEVDEYLATNLPAVIGHFPTADIGAWSPAHSLDQGGSLGNERVREAGHDAFEKHQLPITVTSAIVETLLEFRELRPDACKDVSINWSRYGRLALQEIENMKLPPRERWKRQLLVLRATQRDGLDVEALSAAMRVVIAGRSAKLTRAYNYAREALRPPPPPPSSTFANWTRRPAASLAAARLQLADAFAARNSAA